MYARYTVSLVLIPECTHKGETMTPQLTHNGRCPLPSHRDCFAKGDMSNIHTPTYKGSFYQYHSQHATQYVGSYGRKKLLLLLILSVFTASFGQPLSANAQSCQSLIPDGDFEQITNWQVRNSDGLSLFTRQVAHTGQQSAYLGGRHNAADRLSTVVQIPDASTITLSLWWQLQSQEASTGNDELYVLAINSDRRTLTTLLHLSGRNAGSDWQVAEIDLHALAGQTIELQILSYTDGEAITDFFLDDVELIACGGDV